jgi:hypothetical protein
LFLYKRIQITTRRFGVKCLSDWFTGQTHLNKFEV